MLAASRLTSVPVFPMATPMSACFSAGASFTESPSVKKRSSPYQRGDVDGSASGPHAEAAAGTLAASASLADRLLTLRRGRIRR